MRFELHGRGLILEQDGADAGGVRGTPFSSNPLDTLNQGAFNQGSEETPFSSNPLDTLNKGMENQ